MNPSKTYSHFCVGKRSRSIAFPNVCSREEEKLLGVRKKFKAGSLSRSLRLTWHEAIYSTPHIQSYFLQISAKMTSVHLFFGRGVFTPVTGSQHSPSADSTGAIKKNQVATLGRLYLEIAIVSLLSDIGRVWIALRFTGVYVAPVQKTRFVDLIRWTTSTTFIQSSRGRSLITEPFCFNLRTETQSRLCRKTACFQPDGKLYNDIYIYILHSFNWFCRP